MADPIRFCGFNKRLTAPPGRENDVKTLHVFSNGRENISCWKLNPMELKQVLETGEVWISIMSGQTSPPIYVSGTPLMMSQDLDTGDETVYYSDGRHIVEDARRFAILHHGTQQYGDGLPYSYHLEGVVQVLRDFGADWPFLVAAYGHDLEEDCWQDEPIEVRRQRVADRFGPLCEAMIWACTGLMFIDGVKQKRKARNAQQYVKIQAFPQAAPVKIADRTFNMEESARTGHSMCEVYVGEVLEFDVNVGIHCPPEMRLRLFQAAEACLVHLPDAEPELVQAILARKAEIVALTNPPSLEAA